MKATMEVQFSGKDILVTDIEKAVKEELKNAKVKMVQIDTLEMFYKPGEAIVYYVATLKDETVIEGCLDC